MPLQLEFKQMPQAFTMTRLHAGDCRSKEVVVAHGALGFSELEECLLVLHFHSRSVVEQGIPVVEQRSRTSQSICPGIYEETKISKVSVGIGDDGIEDEHIFQRIDVLRPKRFVVLDDSLHPTVLHDIAYWDKRQLLTGEKLTLGTSLRFQLGDSVRDSGDAKGFGNLPSVELGVRLVAGVGRTFRTSLYRYTLPD